MKAALFDTRSILYAQEGKEAEFFESMTPEVASGLIELNGLAIAIIRHLDQLGGILQPPSPNYAEKTIAALKESIRLAKGDPEATEAEGLRKFQAMSLNDQANLAAQFVSG